MESIRRLLSTATHMEVLESEVETMISPPILWPTGQRIPGVDANAYIQRSFERLSGWPTRWPTGQRMIYPPIRKKPVCVSGRNAIQIQSKSILGGCPGLTSPPDPLARWRGGGSSKQKPLFL